MLLEFVMGRIDAQRVGYWRFETQKGLGGILKEKTDRHCTWSFRLCTNSRDRTWTRSGVSSGKEIGCESDIRTGKPDIAGSSRAFGHHRCSGKRNRSQKGKYILRAENVDNSSLSLPSHRFPYKLPPKSFFLVQLPAQQQENVPKCTFFFEVFFSLWIPAIHHRSIGRRLLVFLFDDICYDHIPVTWIADQIIEHTHYY